jgi:hypothetical protein
MRDARERGKWYRHPADCEDPWPGRWRGPGALIAVMGRPDAGGYDGDRLGFPRGWKAGVVTEIEPTFDDLWRVFCAADAASRGDLLAGLLRAMNEHGLTAEQLRKLAGTPGIQFLSERALIDGALPPAGRQASDADG